MMEAMQRSQQEKEGEVERLKRVQGQRDRAAMMYQAQMAQELEEARSTARLHELEAHRVQIELTSTKEELALQAITSELLWLVSFFAAGAVLDSFDSSNKQTNFDM